jgi:hypothetical protein
VINPQSSSAKRCQAPFSGTFLAVARPYAYLANFDSGLRIIDVSDPTAPFEVGSLPFSVAAEVVAVAGRYAYVGTDNDQVWAIDVSNPVDPVAVGSVPIQGSVVDIAVIGPYVYVSHGDGMVLLNRCEPASFPGFDPGATATWHATTP